MNETNFPDDVFRNYILDNVDADGSGALSQSEIDGARGFYLSGMSIEDLTGIGYFTELTTLICQNNQLTSLDVSQNTKLDNLTCNGNALTSLDVSRLTALTRLSCQDNQLTSLDVSGCAALQILYCYNNKLTSLTTGNAPLTNITCHTNQLTSLDLSGNQALRALLASNNQLASLDTRNNPDLDSIDCSRNYYLTSLDLSRNTEMTSLTAAQCGLSFLDLSSNTKLKYLDAFENYLIGVNLPGNLSFDFFRVSYQWENTITPGTVAVDEDYDFDLASIAPGLDSARISNLKGAASLDGSVLRSLTVTEPVEFTYDCGSGQTMDVSLNVYAANQWIRELSMEGWKYGETAKQPTAAARFGTAVFTYSDAPDGGYADEMPSDAGIYYVKASVGATSSYPELESLPVMFEIARGTPAYAIPTDLTAVEGDTLADVALPEGFSWQDPGTTSVGNPGENTFRAVYTPADINYETVTDIELIIRVSAKETAPGGTGTTGTDRSDETAGLARTDSAAASVRTGDVSNTGIYTALLIASGALSVLLLCRKKKAQI